MPQDRADEIDSKTFSKRLLRNLRSPDPGPAWSQFLDCYAPLMMHVVQQFEHQQDRADDCFIYISEQLSDNGFRRLLRFDTAGKASLRTWLGTVVFNLCVDWHRREYGRATLLPAIAALPKFDQSVYRLVIEQGMDKERCYQTLKPDFPDLTRELVSNAVARTFSLLTPRQRWQICVRNHRRIRANPAHGEEWLRQLPDPATGPEAEAQRQQQVELLNAALSGLPLEQRLLLRFRYQEGMTLRQIAKLQYSGDTNLAWRRIQSATDNLIQILEPTDFEQERKT